MYDVFSRAAVLIVGLFSSCMALSAEKSLTTEIRACSTAGPTLSWDLSVSPATEYTVERWTTDTKSWAATGLWKTEPWGYVQSADIVEPGSLYRVAACYEKVLDERCLRSAVVWSPFYACAETKEAAQSHLDSLTEIEVRDENGKTLEVFSMMGRKEALHDRISQYNIYMVLKLLFESIDRSPDMKIPLMTKPFPVGYDESTMRVEDHIKLSVYVAYEKAAGRKPDLVDTGLDYVLD